jgi:hypothetical protein
LNPPSFIETKIGSAARTIAGTIAHGAPVPKVAATRPKSLDDPLVFKTGRAGQPPAWKVRFLRRSVAGDLGEEQGLALLARPRRRVGGLRSRPPKTA